VLLDYHWTVWAVHVQVVAMRIDRIGNRATEDNARVKAAVWLVAVHMVYMVVCMVPMMVFYAMPMYMRRRPVVVPALMVHALALPPRRMASVVSQRWS
jgi:hypothetical protein